MKGIFKCRCRRDPEKLSNSYMYSVRVVLSLLFGGPNFSFTYYVMYVLIPGIDYVIRGVESLLRETTLMSRGPPVTCICD